MGVARGDLAAVKVDDVVVVNDRNGKPMTTVKVQSVLGAVITDTDGHRWAKKDGARLPRGASSTFIDVVDADSTEAVERGVAETTVFRFYDRMRKKPPVSIEHLRRVVAAIESEDPGAALDPRARQ